MRVYCLPDVAKLWREEDEETTEKTCCCREDLGLVIDILFVVPVAVLGVVASLSIGFILIEVYPCLDVR